MTPRTKAAVLWGGIGGLLFLVLAQAMLLAGQPLPVSFAGLFGIGAAVGVVTAICAYLLEARLG